MSQLVFKDFCIHWIFDHPWYAISGCFASFYTVYYLAFIVKRPILSCGDKKFRQFIDTYCPISKERFWPTWWCFESRAQTILRALIQSSPKVDYTSEHLTTSDGGEIRLDWNENDSNSKFSKHERPTILMLPGLTGSSKENYILHMVYDARNLGYRSVVFNNRGTGDTQLKTPRTYCAANTEDTEFVIKHIRTKYPNAPLIGVGVSLGGNLHLFERNVNIDTAHVLKSESIKDFDERFTSKLFGYSSVDHYYTEASLHTKVHSLARPVLCLSAADDPFAPETSIPMKEAEENENIAIVKTACGGHIGFLEGTFPSDRSYMYRWFQQFVSGMFEHGLKSD
ncbi:phospholipase ABHD3-like isoform X4 [Biomphalaria glabrata]|uniref:Phospholipase ABHD3-like isoform X4 n=1 Tax=Biomphalaria glabrata TaxID=6526 RepID=A0A9W2YEZ8_BIOGL|nr:phospholipase ABHD3-like isoform X4 [Biomphalaria glabrata]